MCNLFFQLLWIHHKLFECMLMHPFWVYKCTYTQCCTVWKYKENCAPNDSETLNKWKKKKKHCWRNNEKTATHMGNNGKRTQNGNKNAKKKIKWMKRKIDIDLHILLRQHSNCIITIWCVVARTLTNCCRFRCSYTCIRIDVLWLLYRYFCLIFCVWQLHLYHHIQIHAQKYQSHFLAIAHYILLHLNFIYCSCWKTIKIKTICNDAQ